MHTENADKENKNESSHEDRRRDHKSFHQPTTLLWTEDEANAVDWERVWTDW